MESTSLGNSPAVSLHALPMMCACRLPLTHTGRYIQRSPRSACQSDLHLTHGQHSNAHTSKPLLDDPRFGRVSREPRRVVHDHRAARAVRLHGSVVRDRYHRRADCAAVWESADRDSGRYVRTQARALGTSGALPSRNSVTWRRVARTMRICHCLPTRKIWMCVVDAEPPRRLQLDPANWSGHCLFDGDYHADVLGGAVHRDRRAHRDRGAGWDRDTGGCERAGDRTDVPARCVSQPPRRRDLHGGSHVRQR